MYTSFLEIKGRIYINVLLIFIIEKKYFFIDWKSLLEFITTSFFYNWDTLNQVSEVMLQLPYLESFERMIHFFILMDLIGKSKTNVQLASKEYLKIRFKTGNKRVADIHEYLMNNYREEVNLKELAGLVNMAEGSLCRFFKMNMGITLFEYLNKIKIEFACKLLMDQDLSIMEVCFDSGFNNISHFNKQFKKTMGVPPFEYRKRFKGLR